MPNQFVRTYRHDKGSIADRIRSLIEESGMNQAEFAEAMGMSRNSRQSISHWVMGNRLPSTEQLLKMSDIFKVDVGYILCEHNFRKIRS